MAARLGFKEKLVAGDRPRAFWVSIPWAPIVEIAADAGCDAVLVDMQHSTLQLPDIDRFVLAARAASVSILVRPRSVERLGVSALLDLGVDGIVFPDVRTAEDARRAGRCMRYAPEGGRDWGGSHTRSAGWAGASAVASVAGSGASEGIYSPGYVARTDEGLTSIYLVGSEEGVANLEEIVAAGKPDAIVFAAGQFSLESSFERAPVEEARQRFDEICARLGVPVAGAPGLPGAPAGFTLAGNDVLAVRNAIHAALGDD